MRSVAAIERVILRWRYPILVAWSLLCMLLAYNRSRHGLTDWNVIEYGARSLIHLNRHYPDGLHLYADNPEVQVGPPPLVLLAGLQWLPPNPVAFAFTIVMAICGVGVVGSCEYIARKVAAVGDQVADRVRRQRGALLGGLLLLGVWGHFLGRYRHLDDVFAIGMTIGGIAVILRRSRHSWWIAALLVGTAVASKPWALGAMPVLVGVPRERRSQAVLLALATVAGWYGPFVLADHSTISSLSGYRLPVQPTSSLHSLGEKVKILAPTWLRNVQIGSAVVAGLALARRDRWIYVPFAAFSIRVVLDPQTFGYYGLGPVAGALLVDLCRRSRLPWWTIVTVGVEFLVPYLLPGAQGEVRIVWFVAVMATLFAPERAYGRLGLRPWHRLTTSRTA